MNSLGILGGTFNPPHLGHLSLARHAQRELALDRVLLVPAHTAPHKPDERDPGPEHRLRMCELAVDGTRALSVCAIEIERGGVSYTVDTLTSLHARHPEAELTLIVGADMAGTLGAWREPGRLLSLARLAVAARPGSSRRPVLDALATLGVDAHDPPARAPGDESQRVAFLDMPPIDVSSSLARARAARGEPIERLVGRAVAAYVAEHGLYRTHGAGGG